MIRYHVPGLEVEVVVGAKAKLFIGFGAEVRWGEGVSIGILVRVESGVIIGVDIDYKKNYNFRVVLNK